MTLQAFLICLVSPIIKLVSNVPNAEKKDGLLGKSAGTY